MLSLQCFNAININKQVTCFTGELLQTLSHDRLPSEFAGIPSVKDGVVAVPGWKKNKLCLFRVT